ncbi:MAG: hypothetical protein ACRDH5_04910, partial [bacterium]
AALALIQRQPARFLIAAMLLAVALRSARGLPVMALIGLPLACAAIRTGLESAQLRLKLNAVLAYSRRLREIDRAVSGWLLAPAALVLVFATRMPAGFPPDQFPVAAAARVESLPSGARILAPDKFGGYLIYRFAGARPVFFDGRSDLYGAEFLKSYARMVQVRPGWRKDLDSHNFTHALLPNDYSLVPALEAIGWKQLYRDPVATLLERGN